MSHARGCASAATLVVLLSLVAYAPSPTAAGNLTVRTWNLYTVTSVQLGQLAFVAETLQERFDTLVAVVCDPESQADIWLVQELFDDPLQEALIRSCTRAGLHVASGSRRVWAQSGDGLAIVSKLPLRNPGVHLRHSFPTGDGPDGLARKGVLAAVVDVADDVPLLLLNTHMQSDALCFPAPFSLFFACGSSAEATRKLQMHQIGEFAAALSARLTSPAILLAGDFNFSDNDTSVVVANQNALNDPLGSAGPLTDVWLDQHGLPPSEPGVTTALNGRLDKVYVSPDVTVSSTDLPAYVLVGGGARNVTVADYSDHAIVQVAISY